MHRDNVGKSQEVYIKKEPEDEDGMMLSLSEVIKEKKSISTKNLGRGE